MRIVPMSQLSHGKYRKLIQSVVQSDLDDIKIQGDGDLKMLSTFKT